MNYQEYYQTLLKPPFSPPEWVFGVAWGILYPIIFVSFIWVFLKYFKGDVPGWVALPFALNLFFNLIFTYIQFTLKNNFLASIDILLVVGTLIWALLAIYPHIQWVTWVNIPYLLWGLFATTLQIWITVINWAS